MGGVLAKLGTYGIFRFGLGLFPDAWAALSPFLAIWAAGERFVWLDYCDRTKRHQTHGCLQLHRPHGLRHAWWRGVYQAQHGRRYLSDGVSWA